MDMDPRNGLVQLNSRTDIGILQPLSGAMQAILEELVEKGYQGARKPYDTRKVLMPSVIRVTILGSDLDFTTKGYEHSWIAEKYVLVWRSNDSPTRSTGAKKAEVFEIELHYKDACISWAAVKIRFYRHAVHGIFRSVEMGNASGRAFFITSQELCRHCTILGQFAEKVCAASDALFM